MRSSVEATVFCLVALYRFHCNSNHFFSHNTDLSSELVKIVPHLFHQLYIIHGLDKNTAIPVVYAVQPNKTEETSVRLLSKVNELLPESSHLQLY